MNWTKIYQFHNIIGTSYDSFDKALILGYIIFYNNNSELKIISTNTLNFVDNTLENGSSYYKIFHDKCYFYFNKEIKALDLKFFKFETIATTDKENISVLNAKFCIGNTSKRSPRIYKNEIINLTTNLVIYEWEDDKNLLFELNNIFYFQTKFKGNLFAVDIKTNESIWEIEIDNGIAGRRYFQELSNDELLIQKYFETGLGNLLKINLVTGQIIWEIENSLSFYNYNKLNNKLYGLGSSTFEIVNAETGEREMRKELDLHIPPHLTFYADGYLFFSGYKGDGVTRIFGAVDVNSGEIAFTQSIETPNGEVYRGCYDRPIVVGNRLYIRDQQKTLHIYERHDA